MARKKDVAPRALLRPAKPVQATAAAARNRRAVKTPVNYNVDNDYDSAASSSDDDIDELLNDVEDTLEERPTNAGRKRKAAEQDGDFGEHEGSPKRKRAKGKAALKQIDKGPFRFFDLPAELRNMVYERALVDINGTVSITASGPKQISRKLFRAMEFQTQDEKRKGLGKGALFKELERAKDPKGLGKKRLGKWDVNAPFSPQLLRVCKQTWNETLPVLYGKNHFLMQNERAFSRFTTIIGKGIEYIQIMSLASFTSNPDSSALQRKGFHALINATSLKALILEPSYLKGMRHNVPAAHRQGSRTRRIEVFYNFAHDWLWSVPYLLAQREKQTLFAKAKANAKATGKDTAKDEEEVTCQDKPLDRTLGTKLLFFPDEFERRYPGEGASRLRQSLVNHGAGAFYGQMWTEKDISDFLLGLQQLMMKGYQVT